MSAMPALPSGAAVMSSPIGYDALCRMAKELGRPQGTLTVLSHGSDPFGCGTPRHISHAEWFAALWREHMTPRRPPATLALSAWSARRRRSRWSTAATMRTHAPVGSCSRSLGKWARYLGLIDADDIDDKRSPSPRIYLTEETELEQPAIQIAEPEYFRPASTSAPSLPDLPQLNIGRPSWRPRASQRYHVEIWVEKSDVEDIVLPIARTYGLNYCPFSRPTRNQALP